MENNDPAVDYNDNIPERDDNNNPPATKEPSRDANRNIPLSFLLPGARPKSAKPPTINERRLCTKQPGKSPDDDFDEHKFKVQFQTSLEKISQNETRDIVNSSSSHHL